MTVLTAVLIAVLGLIANETLKFYVFQRVSKYCQIREQIAYAIGFHANVYWDEKNPREDKEAQEACDEIRGLAFKLVAFINERHSLLSHWRIPTVEQLTAASRGLVGLSNSLGRGDAATRKQFESEIQEALGLRSLRDLPENQPK